MQACSQAPLGTSKRMRVRPCGTHPWHQAGNLSAACHLKALSGAVARVAAAALMAAGVLDGPFTAGSADSNEEGAGGLHQIVADSGSLLKAVNLITVLSQHSSRVLEAEWP